MKILCEDFTLQLFKSKLDLQSTLQSIVGSSISRSSKGRPYVKNNSIDFNISNKEDIHLLGWTTNRKKIGVDLEKINDGFEDQLFKKFILSENEKLNFSSFLLDSGFRESFLIKLIWSAKESFFKLKDRDLEFHKVQLIEINKAGRFRLKDVNQLEYQGLYWSLGDVLVTTVISNPEDIKL